MEPSAFFIQVLILNCLRVHVLVVFMTKEHEEYVFDYNLAVSHPRLVKIMKKVASRRYLAAGLLIKSVPDNICAGFSSLVIQAASNDELVSLPNRAGKVLEPESILVKVITCTTFGDVVDPNLVGRTV